MTSNEDRLRTALHDLAGGQASVRVDLPQFRRRRRARTWRQALAAVAGVAAIAGTLGVVNTQLHEPAPPPATAPPGQSVLSYRGVQVTVPTAWTKDSRMCSTPFKDIAYVQGNSPTFTCLAINDHSGELTEISLSDTFSGFKAGRSTTKDGRTQIIRVFDDRRTSLTVTAPEPIEAQRYADAAVALPGSARIDGCLVHDQTASPVPRQDQTGRLLPEGDVGAGSACGYDDGWLDYSKALTPQQATNLATSFGEAPVTTEVFPTVDPERCWSGGVRPVLTYTLNLPISGQQHRLWIYTNNCRQAAVINEQGSTAAGPWSLVKPVFFLMWPTFQIDVNTG